MQHIEEALLHEYLDRRGESDPSLTRIDDHLAVCAECRARLQAADELRAGAESILRAASPARIKAPSFESIVAAANARAAQADTGDVKPGDSGVVASAVTTAAPVRRSALNDGRRLAWAATVVLALGAGWIGRTLYQGNSRGADDTQAASDATRNTRGSAGPDTSAVTPAQPEDMIASSAPATAPAAPAPARDARDAAARIEAGATTGGGAAQASDMNALSRVAEADRPAAPPAAATDAGRAEKSMIAAAPAPPPPTAPSVAQGAAAAAQRADTSRAVDLGALQIRGSRNPLVPRDQVSSRSIITDDGMVRPGSWATVSGEEALLKAGGEIVRMAGLKVIDYAIAADQNDTRIRVRQVTAQGDTVAVVQTAAAPLGKMAATSAESANARAFAAAPAPVAASFTRESSGYILGHPYHAGRINGSRRIAIIARNATLIETLKPEIARTW